MSDFCYSFPVFRRVYAQAELMDRMISQSGVNPLDVVRCDGGMSWFEARTRCIDCNSDNQCRAWLESAPRGGPVPQFCPNADFLNQCRQDNAGCESGDGIEG